MVAGSGILSAYDIRESNDIDVVVGEDLYRKLAEDPRFTKKESYGLEVLVDDLFEIRTMWGVLGKDQTVGDLMRESVVINDVRYTSLDFLLRVKRSWLQDENVRQKDIDDVKLIEDYLARQDIV